MNCLSCRHMLTVDCDSERIYRCGHDSMSRLDTNEPAAVIAKVNWSADPDVRTPAWCPYKTEPLPEPKSLFGDEP